MCLPSSKPVIIVCPLCWRPVTEMVLKDCTGASPAISGWTLSILVVGKAGRGRHSRPVTAASLSTASFSEDSLRESPDRDRGIIRNQGERNQSEPGEPPWRCMDGIPPHWAGNRSRSRPRPAHRARMVAVPAATGRCVVPVAGRSVPATPIGPGTATRTPGIMPAPSAPALHGHGRAVRPNRRFRPLNWTDRTGGQPRLCLLAPAPISIAFGLDDGVSQTPFELALHEGGEQVDAEARLQRAAQPAGSFDRRHRRFPFFC